MKTLIDFNKVVYVLAWWENQDGSRMHGKPTFPTVHGCRIVKDEMAAYHHDYPFETTYERALRLDILDVWMFKVKFMVYSNHAIQYSGGLAETMYNNYLKWKMGKNKKNK